MSRRLPALTTAVLAIAAFAAAAAPAAHAAPATCTVGTFLSDDPGRAGAVPLAGRSVSGDVHVFADAVAPLATVTFTLSGEQGVVRTVVEAVAGFDLATTGDDGRARPLRTRELPDGDYTVTTEWTYGAAAEAACADAPRTATTTFTVDNTSSCAVGLVASPRADRRGARSLRGEVSGDLYVFIDAPRRPGQELSEATAVVDEVRLRMYRVGDPGEELLRRVEAYPAFDLLGSGPDGRPRPLRTSTLPPGEYVVDAEWTFVDESIFGCGDTNHGSPAMFTIPGRV